MDNLHKIEVNFEEIVLAVEDYKSLCTSYLDTQTGKVITLLEDINENTWYDNTIISKLPAWEKSSALEAINIFTDENDRYIYIPKINVCEEYEFMCDFTDTISDDDIRLILLDVLDKKDSFRGFVKVLDNYPELIRSWYEFKEQQLHQFVIDFLNENGINYIPK